MQKNIILGLAIISLFLSCQKNATNPADTLTFDEKLNALTDLTITEMTP